MELITASDQSPKNANTPGPCRICGAPLSVTFCDLGKTPLSNSYITLEQLRAGKEQSYPLHAYVCAKCKLVQLEAFETPEAIFSDYAYFSSYATTLVEHAERYSEMITHRLGMKPATSLVVEIASNDGYLLRNFVRNGFRVLGVEPAQNVARVAREQGIPTETVFFGGKTAGALRDAYGSADLMVANNVIAHVPDLHDFIDGFRVMLASAGTATIEFPHLLHLMQQTQFDTIYHEHFSYFALAPLLEAFRMHELEIVDVDEIATHGGSLRIYVKHRRGAQQAPSIARMLQEERVAGLEDLSTYAAFQARVENTRDEFLAFLRDAKEKGLTVAGYGAPAKGNTFLNYCGVGIESLPYTVDVSPHKQGHLLPGVHIPIYAPERIYETKPDRIVVLAWNLIAEIKQQLQDIATWDGRLVVAIPRLRVID
ncbi:MAG: methyltransferase domain-containing protein [Vulcanimicrobiaceae bacterium]